MYKPFFLFWVGGGLKIQKQTGAGLAPLGNFWSANIRSCICAEGVRMTGHRHVLQNFAQGCQPGTCLFLIYDSLPYSKPKKNSVHTDLQGYPIFRGYSTRLFILCGSVIPQQTTAA